MDIVLKKPVLAFSLFSIFTMTIMCGVAIARLSSWNNASAQTDLATQTSFACEPLVFTLSASDEASPSGSPLASGSATPVGTSTPRPSATSQAQGGISPSPTSSAIAQATTSPTATAKPSVSATAKPTSTAIAQGGTLPDAGISTPTIIGMTAGLFLLLAAAFLALK